MGRFDELTTEDLKKIWAGIADDPFQNATDENIEEFIIDCELAIDVLERNFWTLGFDRHYKVANEDAIEILFNCFNSYSRDFVIDTWLDSDSEAKCQMYNDWWWRHHNPEDYVDA